MSKTHVTILSFLALLGIFVFDYVTPLGFAVWLLYFFVLVASSWAVEREASLVIAAASTAAIAIGFFTDEPGIAPGVAAFNRALMVAVLWFAYFVLVQRKKAADLLAARDWIKTGLARLDDAMRGVADIEALCGNIVSEMVTRCGGRLGALYLYSEREGCLLRRCAHACAAGCPERFALGEGLVGQAGKEKKESTVSPVPGTYLRVESGLGQAAPETVHLVPLLHDDDLVGVLEIGRFGTATAAEAEYLQRAAPAAAIAIDLAQKGRSLAEALAQSQTLAEELQSQQEELEAANEELEEQTLRLGRSEERLKEQQQELQAANEELRMTNEELEQQKDELEAAKRDLERTGRELEEHAERLSEASRYKSEFLANMSHELRTPLNSLLLLSRVLQDNREGNLTGEQLEALRIVNRSGMELLSLIESVLDLSKIEAGRMELTVEPVAVADLAESVAAAFRAQAGQKGLTLETSLGGAPPEVRGDRKKIEQILRNLVSNAVKFTEKGGVRIEFGPAAVPGGLSVAVRDTGIGIPADRLDMIFEAFWQAEGGTARKYGGTGLGLSISRELAHLMDGSIRAESEPGKGSVFTLTLPPPAEARQAERAGAAPRPVAERRPSPDDDRDVPKGGSPVLLIIEDDASFASLLRDEGRRKGFRAVVASTGEEGLELARSHRPRAILLDLRLPGIDGWGVLQRLKSDVATRHIPVHILSVEEPSSDALRWGAVGFLKKPVSPEELDGAFRKLESAYGVSVKRLLVVEDDGATRAGIVRLVGNGDVKADEAATAAEAMSRLRERPYDCIVLDLGLPDMNGFDLLERLREERGGEIPPVIIFTGRELTWEEERRLSDVAGAIVVKGARADERLLDEVSLFLHRSLEKLPEEKRKILSNLYDTDAPFRGKTVLVVDDDMRNAFAIGRALQAKGMRILKAENGRRALDLLDTEPSVDIVLMDIMMPVLDGYDTMRRIREQPRFRKLPIVALTAKAMKGDRDRCIEAGASDYIPKPVDLDRLGALLRIWLYR